MIRRAFLRATPLLLGLAFLLLTLTGTATAATITGEIDGASTIEVGETTLVSLYLELAEGEEASIFQGGFDLVGLGVSADAEAMTAAVSAEWAGGSAGADCTPTRTPRAPSSRPAPSSSRR